jgi:hypothetical protein
MTNAELIEQIRNAVADYMWSEGCGCCRNHEAHEAHQKRLGELLEVPPDTDGNHNFFPYRTAKGKESAK